MQNEFDVWSKSSHPNIMKVRAMFKDAKNYYIVSEFMPNGDLFDFIFEKKLCVANGTITELQVAAIARQIFEALNYMHMQKIIHRDIKPDNILLCSKDIVNPKIKLTDFGFAKEFNPDVKLRDWLGTPEYMAPEIIADKGYGRRVDIWAAGLIIWELFQGERLFDATGKSDKQFEKEIMKGKTIDFTKLKASK